MMDRETRELTELLQGIQDGLAARVAAKMEAPRVLEYWEIPEFDGAVLLEYFPDKNEESETEWALFKRETRAEVCFRTQLYDNYALPSDEHGVWWRAWTGRPTEAQKAATRWWPREQNGSRERAEKLMRELSGLGNALMEMTREVADILQAIDEEEDDG